MESPPDRAQQYHTRRNALTEEDADLIRSIVESIYQTKVANIHPVAHDCRFPGVSTEEFMEIIKSHRKFNLIMDDGKKTARKVILTLVLVFIAGILSEGLWSILISKLKQFSG